MPNTAGNSTRVSARRLLTAAVRTADPTRLRSLHADQRGTISLMTVFAMMLFTMLLVMIVNVATHLDDKIKMQTAADAATYSGGVVLARGMNAIAFTNHLEADVLAVTAFLREAEARTAESQVPIILSAWDQMGQLFARATFPKFQPLPDAISGKVPLEQEFVTAWGEMAAAGAELALPVFETILGTPETEAPAAQDRLIPNFQRAVLQLTPELSQAVTLEVALRHGLRQGQASGLSGQMRDNPSQGGDEREPLVGVLWRHRQEPVGSSSESDPAVRTLPIVDPSPYGPDFLNVPDGAAYLDEARRIRESLARDYLSDWIYDRDITRGLDFADEEVRMSQFARMFWSAACGQLVNLLELEYPTSNVPMMMRRDAAQRGNDVLDAHFTYIGIAYRKQLDEAGPGMYRNPLGRSSDALTFAQLRLYLPRARFRCCPWVIPVQVEQSGRGQTTRFQANRDWWVDDRRGDPPDWWNSFNQNWTVRLVPATAETIPTILQTNPGGPVAGFRLPPTSQLSYQEFDALNTH